MIIEFVCVISVGCRRQASKCSACGQVGPRKGAPGCPVLTELKGTWVHLNVRSTLIASLPDDACGDAAGSSVSGAHECIYALHMCATSRTFFTACIRMRKAKCRALLLLHL